VNIKKKLRDNAHQKTRRQTMKTFMNARCYNLSEGDKKILQKQQVVEWFAELEKEFKPPEDARQILTLAAQGGPL
jgi:hypothetical protein